MAAGDGVRISVRYSHLRSIPHVEGSGARVPKSRPNGAQNDEIQLDSQLTINDSPEKQKKPMTSQHSSQIRRKLSAADDRVDREAKRANADT